MVTFREAAEAVIRDTFCAVTDAAADFGEFLGDSTSGLPVGGALQRSADNYRAGIEFLGCRDGDGSLPGGGTQPVFGNSMPGQCDAVLYFLRYRVRRASDNVVVSDTTRRVWGPIGAEMSTNSGWGYESRGDSNFGSIGPQAFQFRQVVSGSNDLFADIFQVNGRVDGQPDTCGTDGQPLPPGDVDNNPRSSGPISWDDPDGTPQTDNYDITFRPPIFFPGGNLDLPGEICVGAVCLDFNLDIGTGDIEFSFGGEGNGEGCCQPAGPVTDPGQSPEDPPDNNEPSTIQGAVILSTPVPGETPFPTVFGNGVDPNLYLPRLCSVRFAVRIGGVACWTKDCDVKSLKQYVQVPEGLTAYAVSVVSSRGWSATISPVLISQPPEPGTT